MADPHVDKLKTPPATEEYRKNHDRIFGKVPTQVIDDAHQEKLRREHHKREVAAGKKDAAYYMENEVRISQDPNYKPKPRTSEEYKEGWDRIFGGKKDAGD